jgi:transposase
LAETEDQVEQPFDVVVGLDIGKHRHHLVALDRQGTTLLARSLSNNEADLRELIAFCQQHGQVVLVVDQPATVGALPVAVARAAGVTVAYLPGLTMRRMADVFPGEAKTDARDALVIATTAQTASRRTCSDVSLTHRMPPSPMCRDDAVPRPV